MLAFVGTKITEHLSRLKDGSLLCMAVPIARTGRQMYKAEELASMGGVLPPGYGSEAMVTVHRPAEEVMSAYTRASFEGVPICDTHPPTFVSPTNFRAWQSGHAQNVREGPRTPDGERTLVADLVVRDGNLADKIERRLLREVSCGYECRYEQNSDGSFTQRGITGNHIAVVPNARGGSALQIMDADSKGGSTMTLEQVMAELARINQLIDSAHQTQTQDGEPEGYDAVNDRQSDDIARRFGRIDPAAQEFADAARRFHRSFVAGADCRPALREKADARRESQVLDERSEKTPAEVSAEYAETARGRHRQK